MRLCTRLGSLSGDSDKVPFEQFSVCQSLLASRRLLPHPHDVDLGLRLVCGKDATGLGLGPASPPEFKNRSHRGPTRQST